MTWNRTAEAANVAGEARYISAFSLPIRPDSYRCLRKDRHHHHLIGVFDSTGALAATRWRQEDTSIHKHL